MECNESAGCGRKTRRVGCSGGEKTGAAVDAAAHSSGRVGAVASHQHLHCARGPAGGGDALRQGHLGRA